MRSLRTLLVTFTPVSALRGAVIEKVGRENLLFHNHLGDEKFIYKYPLIQYKKVGKQAAIFCMDEGVDEIPEIFAHRNWNIKINEHPVTLSVYRHDMKTTNINIWEKTFDYSLWNWQALNEENWKRYFELDSMTEKIAMLGKILIANILSFAKDIDWHIELSVRGVIRDVKLELDSRTKDIKVRTFEVDFRTNVFLPDFMGLGKGVSKGFGTVKGRCIND